MTIMARKIRLIMELRRAGISDQRVLGALEKVPRENFVLESFLDKAYENTALPIGQGQTISQPYVVAYMTQKLELNDRVRVLEIGTGSGYQAAILAQLSRRLYTIERHRPLQEQAMVRLEEMKYRNIVYRLGDGTKGWKEAAPFDRIMLTAVAQNEIPRTLIDQLAPGGILLAPLRVGALSERLVRLRKNAQGEVGEPEELIDVRFVPLVSEQEVYAGQQRAIDNKLAVGEVTS